MIAPFWITQSLMECLSQQEMVWCVFLSRCFLGTWRSGRNASIEKTIAVAWQFFFQRCGSVGGRVHFIELMVLLYPKFFFQYRKILLAFVDSSLQSFFGKHGNKWTAAVYLQAHLQKVGKTRMIGCFQHVFRCFHLKHVKTCLEPSEHLRSIYIPFRY